jgi:hypothetical protein
MGKTVDANGRSILHKGHGSTHSSAPPDVCKTPSPGGPVPIPYPNIAMDSNLADGAETVKIEGNPLANVAAKIATSTGDEAGTAGGGIMSSKIKGTVTWKMGSPDVKAEGKSVVRFVDSAFHNGNAFNTAFIADGGTGMGYANDFLGPCPLCGEEPDAHAVPSLPSSATLCAAIVAELQAVTKKKKGGYMVGAMVCFCEKKWAAKSGGRVQGFDEAVGRADGAATPINPPGGGATYEQAVNANQSATAVNVAGGLLGAWLGAELNFEDNVPGYNYPGSCAGAKLLINSGHKPVAMTEMWFQPRGLAASMLGPYRRFSMGLRIDDGAFSSAGEIGSCNTCQDILFMTMCPERTCP